MLALETLCLKQLLASCRSPLLSPCLPRATDVSFARLPRQAHEQALRLGARHAGPAASENPRAAAAQRICHQPAPEAGLRRRVAGQRRLGLSRIAQAGARRLDYL